jgi:hypothetical protein
MRKQHLDRRPLMPTNNSKCHSSPEQAHQNQISQAESVVLWLDATATFLPTHDHMTAMGGFPMPTKAMPTKHRVESRLIAKVEGRLGAASGIAMWIHSEIEQYRDSDLAHRTKYS